MKVVTLGTGRRHSGRIKPATLFDINNSLYLIDAGVPANAQMIRHKFPFSDLKAIFITHMHEDYAGDLPDLIKSLVQSPRPNQHTLIMLPEAGAIGGLLGWMKTMHYEWPPELLSFSEVRPGPIFYDKQLRLSAVAIASRQPEGSSFPAYTYVLRAEDKTVVYLGAVKPDLSDFPLELVNAGCDLCLCDATFFDPDLARTVLENCRVKRMICNHSGSAKPGESKSRFRKMLASLPFPAQIARNGNIIEI
ncbi:MAG: MBL fold metallo-hydrolase [Victivallales bacterium]|nr:MBL fold metallo-hydrolase [Victivallales bacterium]